MYQSLFPIRRAKCAVGIFLVLLAVLPALAQFRTSIQGGISSSNLGQASSALGSRIIDLQARFSF